MKKYVWFFTLLVLGGGILLGLKRFQPAENGPLHNHELSQEPPSRALAAPRPEPGKSRHGAGEIAADVPRGNALAAQALAENHRPITEPAFARFAEWSERYLQADADGRAALEGEGIALAQQRREALAEMIQSDPERALQLTAPYEVRTELPPSINSLMEKRISGRGVFSVSVGYPEPGRTPPIARYASIAGHDFRAFTFGPRLNLDSRDNLPMQGIVLDDLFALHKSPVRILEPKEAADVLNRIKEISAEEEICAVSTLPVETKEKETVVEAAGEMVLLCDPSHADDLNEQILAEEASFSVASAYTEGGKKVLMIRVVFSGESTSEGGSAMPVSISTCQNILTDSSTFFQRNSYGRTRLSLHTQNSAITPLLQLPYSKTWYQNDGDWSKLKNHAKTKAGNSGYNLSNYDFFVVCSKHVSSFGAYGWATVGPSSVSGVLLNGRFTQPLMTHELGHNYGVWHAGSWNPDGNDPIGAGKQADYGDIFDTMGITSGGLKHQFNTWRKVKLDWLKSGEFTNVTANATYRIYAHDNTNALGSGRLLALKIVKSDSRTYWVEHRQLFTDNSFLLNGASIRFHLSPRVGTSDTRLLDMNPSTSGFGDSALVIGKTFSDTSANIHITPVGQGTQNLNGSTVRWLDVRVNRNISGNSAPSISSITGPSSGATGESLTFTANATDPDGNALAYYWDFHNGTAYNTDYQSANSRTITKSWNSTGTYKVRCRVTDMRGGISAAREFTVNIGGTPAAPTITAQPQGQTVAVGANATFSVTATGTSKTYQWRFNGVNISGATASAYTRSNVQTTHSGNYSVVVTTAGGSVTSANAALTVQSPINITGQPQSRTNDVGANVTFTVTATGTSPGYQWRFNGANISGATASSYTRSNIQTSHEGNYSVVVNNAVSSVTSANAYLKVNPVDVISITSQPFHRTNNIGDNAYFSVTASGSANLSYQWRFNGANLSGQTNSGLSLSVTSSSNAGNYSVVVSSPGAVSVTSANASLVIPFSNRIKITQWDFNNSPYTGSATTTPSLGSGSVTTTGTAASDTSAPRVGAEADPTSANNYARSLVRPRTADPNKGTGIQFNASTVGYTNIVVTWEQRVGDNASGYWRGQYTTNGATWIDRVVVDKRTLFAQQGNALYGFHSDNLSGVAGVHNNANFAYRIVAEYQSTATGSGSAAYVSADPNGSYNGTGNPASRWDMVTVMGTPIVEPIVITSQPQSATVAVGANHTFSVTASGTLPKYQWRFNGANLSGATASSYTRSNAQLSHTGDYVVVITNSASVVTSAVAVLTVQTPVSITAQPQSQTNYVGSNVTFTVTASGTSPKYQWRFNGANLSGATQSAYTRSNTQLAHQGNYSVIVSNNVSSVTSANAALTVLPVPAERYWSANGSTLGGAGAWNTTDSRWSFTAAGPFSHAWNNANANSAIFNGTAGTITIGAPVTVNQMIFGIAGFGVSGTSAITFAGEEAGVSSPGANNNSLTNTMTVSSPLAGPLLVKTGGGRLNLANTANAVEKWVVKDGIISGSTANQIFGNGNPAGLVRDFVTLDGGGIGIQNEAVSFGSARGIYLGANGGKFGVSSSSSTLTINGPITGPGGITFPGFTSFPGQIHGGAGTFVLSNPENDYEGGTTIATGTVLLDEQDVLPDSTTLTITGSGRLNLNSFSEVVGEVILNGSNARIIDGILFASNYDMRRSGIISAMLAGEANLTKTTANNVTLNAKNIYTGDTTLSEGTITLNGFSTLGDGAGTLYLAGGGIILSQTREEDAALANPVVMSADTTIENSSVEDMPIVFLHDGPWTTTGGTLTLRNTTSTGGGWFEVALANSVAFTQPIALGLSGDKPTQLASINPLGLAQTFSGPISGTGSFRRSTGGYAGGLTVLAADNTYSGGTLVDAGTLLVNNPGPGSGTGSGSVTVDATATLGGNGFIDGNVVVNSGGSISAGQDGAGLLTLKNGLNLSNGGTNVWELTALRDDSDGTAGTHFDQLIVTGGQLQLGGSSKLLLKFNGAATSPNDIDPFWRFNRSWKIVNVNGGQNSAGAFASIVNGSFGSGVFSNHVDGSGNVLLTYTTTTTNELYWSGGGSTLGGAGTWNTSNLRWGTSSSGPFNQAWNNSNVDSGIFTGTAGTVTVGAAVTVNQMTVIPTGYTFSGSSKITFSGDDAGVHYEITTSGDANKLAFTCPLGGSTLIKSGAGRMHLDNTGNTVGKWIVKDGIISPATVSRLGSAPGSLVPDFVTLDGGGIGFDGTTITLGTTRGITLGSGHGKIGVRSSSVVLTLDSPITGPGGVSFPGFSSFPTQIHGGAGTFVLSNPNNNYQGPTTVSVGELKLGASEVLPNGTTLTLGGSARLNLNGFNETVATVVVNGSSARIIGSGTLTASDYDFRNGGVTTAILGGNANLTKTTSNDVGLHAANTYTGNTTIAGGTITLNDVGRFGNGVGTLYLTGGGIVLSSNRTEAATLLNPIVMVADTTIANGNTGSGATLFRHGGTWMTEGGTLTIRNTTSASGGSFDVLLTNVFDFTQPIILGVSGDKPVQLSSFNKAVGSGEETFDQVFDGTISGIGSFKKSVSSGVGGRTVFTRDNSYSGGTVVDAGTLLVNNPGPGSGTGSGIVTVSGSGALAGGGSIAGNVSVNSGASISAGMGAGTLTLKSGLNLSNGGTNIWELAAPRDSDDGEAGVDFDQLVLTGGNLQLGGSSRLVLKFGGDATAPDIADPFWRFNRSWIIVRLDGASNTGSTKFTTIVNATNSAGYFANHVDASGNVVLTFTSHSTGDLFWSADSTSLGDEGTWNTADLKWGNSSHGPFNLAWNNAGGKGAIFESTGGAITVGAPITVKKITVGVEGYSFSGTNVITFSGAGAGVDYPVTTVGDSYRLAFNSPINGAVVTKTGDGRMHLTSADNTVSKWIVKGGIISPSTISRLGPTPGTLVSDFITLDGGGIGFDGTTITLGATRGITLGTNGSNKIGVRSSSVTLNIDAPLTGPGDVSFPGYPAFPTQIHGGGGTFVLNNTNNNYQGETAVGVGILKLGAAGVLPDSTTLVLSGSGRLELNGFNEMVGSVVINGGSARVIGSGALTAGNYELRRSGDITGVLAGNASLSKTTGNTATLSGANTYTGGTVVEEGTLLVNNSAGSGTGSGAVFVDNSGILGGSGFVAGNVTVVDGGGISPGVGVGILTLQNGLDMSSGGTLIWELGTPKDNTNGTAGVDFDRLALTGGQLHIGEDATLLLAFTGTATEPDSQDPFWQVNHTWTIVTLSGATNSANAAFASILNGNYEAGSFSTHVGAGGSIVLTYTANAQSQSSAGILLAPENPPAGQWLFNAETGEITVTWNVTAGGEYEVQYTTDLSTGIWIPLNSTVAEGTTISLTESTSETELQRFYRLLVK